jgi:NADH:ubiquinone oxidoreductase subunit 5 (subunit L)/multisubunit Na+/H+ antiporter MnhA subunit
VKGAAAFNGFRDAWPALDHHAHRSPPEQQGYDLVHKWILPAPWVGLILGFLLYFRGYAVANVLMKVAPLRWIHTWLLRRMYFDELYTAVFIGITMMISKLGSAIDKYVIDGIVNGAAKVVRGLADLSGLNDRYVVDGTVNGVAIATGELGDAVRAPQTGRIRVYVMMLLAAVALCIAAATTVLLIGTGN